MQQEASALWPQLMEHSFTSGWKHMTKLSFYKTIFIYTEKDVPAGAKSLVAQRNTLVVHPETRLAHIFTKCAYWRQEPVSSVLTQEPCCKYAGLSCKHTHAQILLCINNNKRLVKFLGLKYLDLV